MKDNKTWCIKDKEGLEHIVTLDTSGGDRKIYIDGELKHTIPNTLRFSKLFNYEYNFEVCGMPCRIHYIVLPFAGTENPTLVADGIILKSNEKYSSVIPPISLFGWIFIGISLLFLFASIIFGCILSVKYESATYILTTPLLPLVSVLFVRFFSNAPLKESFTPKKAEMIRISLMALVFVTTVVICILILKDAM